MSDIKNKLAGMMILGSIGAMGRQVEEDPNIAALKKLHEDKMARRVKPNTTIGHDLSRISPDEAFITAGQNAENDKWYAAVMRRLAPEHIPEDGNPWAVAAKNNEGFATGAEAKADASKMFPLVPVLSDDGNEYEYPNYTDRVEAKAKILKTAQDRRDKRNARIAENMLKSKGGRK